METRRKQSAKTRMRIELPVVVIEMYNQEIEEIQVIVQNHFYLHDRYAKKNSR
jgi:hypothetical protein